MEQEASKFFHPLRKLSTKMNIFSDKFKCPELDVEMVIPCEASSCAFFASGYEWTFHCALAYLQHHRHPQRKLDLEELSFLFDVPKEEVLERIKESMLHLKRVASLTRLVAKKFEFLPEDRVCCVCEERISEKHMISSGVRVGTFPLFSFTSSADSPNGQDQDTSEDEALFQTISKEKDEERTIELNYCSQDCREFKPPEVIAAEVRFNSDIGEILVQIVKVYKDLKVVAKVIDISEKLIKDKFQVYTGVKPSEIFQPDKPRTKGRPKAVGSGLL